MKPAIYLPALAALLLVPACQTLSGPPAPDVVVVDPAGNPVAGAKIEPIMASPALPTTTTDAEGKAWLGKPQQPILWLNITPPGKPRQHTAWSDQRPIRVVTSR